MTAPKDEKYIVYKREEFRDWCRQVREGSMKALRGELMEGEIQNYTDVMTLALDDAVVMRRQDAFSPPAFDAYSNGIQIVVEILQADEGGSNTGVLRSLEEKALYFREQADAAWETKSKMPD